MLTSKLCVLILVVALGSVNAATSRFPMRLRARSFDDEDLDSVKSAALKHLQDLDFFYSQIARPRCC